MNILVTGGAGFIGSHLVDRLIKDGHRVTVLDNLKSGKIQNFDSQSSQIDFYEIDIRSIEIVKLFIGVDIVYHLAALADIVPSITDPFEYMDVNVMGTTRVLEAARAAGVKKIIYAGSSSCYGIPEVFPTPEYANIDPQYPYALSKYLGEKVFFHWLNLYGMNGLSLRFFNVFGPRQRPDHEYAAVLPKWIWLAMQGNPIDVYGDGTASRDFTYIETVLDIAMTAMKEKVTTEGAVNLAYGNRIFLNETIDLLKKHFPDLKVNYKENRLGDVKESQNAPGLLKSLFPKITPKPFEDALAETVNWLKEFGQSVANGPKTLD